MAALFSMVSTQASLDYTRPALESFFKHTKLGDADKFFLIDNDACLDPTAWGQQFPRLNLIVNQSPRSYAENANISLQLAAQSQADLIYLNNDILFTPDWLPPLLQPPDALVAATGNQNYQYNLGDLQLKPEMTLADLVDKSAELATIVAHHRKQKQGYVRAFKTNFFCVRLAPAVYRKVGPFDTSFGQAGGEDDDYCLRCWLAGIPVLVAEHAFLLHFGGRSTWAGPESREQWAAREQNFIGVFQEKWGPLLARLLLMRDAQILQADPELKRLEQEQGTGALFRELARRGGRPLSCGN